MRILTREWFDTARPDTFRIVPLGDIHLGNAACDEKLFKAAVQRIADDERCYWIGMGDYCEFINRNDPRFSIGSLASWVRMKHLGDLAKAQRDRFLEFVEPIASKCLGLVEGNHERVIQKHYERSIYLDIVSSVKEKGGFDADHKLALGYCGWLVLKFHRNPEGKRGSTSVIRVNLHHGFVGGRLAGAKALNMQRWLWTHDADLVIFGHSHNTASQVECVESVSTAGRLIDHHRIGCYSGTFMSGAEYAEEKGYFPMPCTHIEVGLRPGAKDERDRVHVVTGL